MLQCERVDIPKYIDIVHDSNVVFMDPLSCKQSIAHFGDWARESGISNTTQSTNRNRQLVLGLMITLSITEKYCYNKIPNTLKIYNTECNGPVHNVFKTYFKNYVCSEFMTSSTSPGHILNGVRHEDLQKLSFDDNSFDIVLSSEVFEHIPNPYKAHKEVFRVLKPGGKHVFTVPFVEDGYDDATFAEINDYGKIQYHNDKKYGLIGPLYHGDPVHKNGILVYKIFSKNMFNKLCKIGYRTKVLRINNIFHGVFGKGNIVFVSEKMRM